VLFSCCCYCCCRSRSHNHHHHRCCGFHCCCYCCVTIITTSFFLLSSSPLIISCNILFYFYSATQSAFMNSQTSFQSFIKSINMKWLPPTLKSLEISFKKNQRSKKTTEFTQMNSYSNFVTSIILKKRQNIVSFS